jgi:hypothetical protein
MATVMKKFLFAAICGTLAASGAFAQSSAATDSAPAPQADTRAADLNKMMDIPNWQAGPSAGDAATRANASAPAAPQDQRASDLSATMNLRNWQAGPSSGDATAKIDPSKSASAPAPLSGNGLEDSLQHESTP